VVVAEQGSLSVARPDPTAAQSVERTLDDLVERLSGVEQAPQTKALLIEARRMRSIIANWRSIPPLPSVREEMLARVLHLSAAVGDLAGPRPSQGYGRQPTFSAMRAVGFDDPPSSQNYDRSIVAETTVVTDAFSSLPQTPLDVHSVPLPEELSPHLVMFTDPYSMRADAYRGLRQRLSSSGDPKVIAVASAGRREGRTTVAINLAASLREGARGRVLLLEANLRQPSIAQVLAFTPPACFGVQLLRHRKDPLEPWIAAEQVAPLHVMAVDPKSGLPPLLDPIAFSIAVDRLRLAGYDYIVVDTPPVLESADVNMIADSVDGVLFTAFAKRSDAKSLRRAIEQVGTVTFLGTILLE
jgi:Mrp family chromosome partitioning ATPase